MSRSIRNSLLLICMLASLGLSHGIRPSQKIADQSPVPDLQLMVPQKIGDWKENEQVSPIVADPRQTEALSRIYNQLLSRTYINSDGYRIMLSLAYGGDQSDALQVHKPEVCYPSQGFTLLGKQDGILKTDQGSIPVVRIQTALDQRNELVTYWITVGDQVVANGFQKKLVEMGYGITGRIPDGMLVRISSIDNDNVRAYKLQEQFAKEMLSSIETQYQHRLFGKPSIH